MATRISKVMKQKVWNDFAGKEANKKCPICEIQIIDPFTFECGHIVSKKNGGKIEFSNLKPICTSCNRSMGSSNWKDFEKEYHKFKNNDAKQTMKAKRAMKVNIPKELIIGKVDIELKEKYLMILHTGKNNTIVIKDLLKFGNYDYQLARLQSYIITNFHFFFNDTFINVVYNLVYDNLMYGQLSLNQKKHIINILLECDDKKNLADDTRNDSSCLLSTQTDNHHHKDALKKVKKTPESDMECDCISSKFHPHRKSRCLLKLKTKFSNS